MTMKRSETIFRPRIVTEAGECHCDATYDSHNGLASCRDSAGGVFCVSLRETGLVHAE